MHELVGWVATAAFAVSYLLKERRHLLLMQIVAATLWFTYGLSIRSWPVVTSNVLVATFATFGWLRSRRA